MTSQRFYTLLAIFTAVAVAAAVAAHLLLSIGYALPLTIGTVLLFIAISVAMFYIGKRTARSENKYLFTNAFMGITMLKLFLCAGIILGYVFLGNPKDKLFIIPFFATYFIYTVLEVTFMIRLASETSTKASE